MALLQGNPVPQGLQGAKEQQASPRSPWGLPRPGGQPQTVPSHARENRLMVAGARKEETHSYRRTHMLECSPAWPGRLRISPPKLKDRDICACCTDIPERLTHAPLWYSQNWWHHHSQYIWGAE